MSDNYSHLTLQTLCADIKCRLDKDENLLDDALVDLWAQLAGRIDDILALIPIVPGMRFVTLRGETDTDDEGNERTTPAGTLGVILHRVDAKTWALGFENGACVCPTETELRDTAQYRRD